MSTLLANIGELVTNDGGDAAGPGAFASVSGAALVIEGAQVAWTGPASRAPAADQRIDCGGRVVLPGFVDSHAHLVFAGERSAEFAARMAGTAYRAGGIATTVAATRAATTSNSARTCAPCVRRCWPRAPPPSNASRVTG